MPIQLHTNSLLGHYGIRSGRGAVLFEDVGVQRGVGRACQVEADNRTVLVRPSTRRKERELNVFLIGFSVMLVYIKCVHVGINKPYLNKQNSTFSMSLPYLSKLSLSLSVRTCSCTWCVPSSTLSLRTATGWPPKSKTTHWVKEPNRPPRKFTCTFLNEGIIKVYCV